MRKAFSFQAILAFVTIRLYLFALSYIPVPTSLETSDTFTAYLSRLIILGTMILGLLSGLMLSAAHGDSFRPETSCKRYLQIFVILIQVQYLK